MGADIINTIIDELVSIFSQEMSALVATGDELRLQRCEAYPFQEDPTEVAPFVWISPDLERGRIPDPSHPPDIGGGCRWMNFFHIRGRIPQQESKTDAYTKIGEFNRRALVALRSHYDLSSLESDDGEIIYYSPPNHIGKNLIRVFGGESEWFGEFRTWCHFFSEEPASFYTG